jgi:endonuclease III
MPLPTSKDAFAGTKTRIKKIIERLAKIHPDAKLDLDFSCALELLIALILAAQARDDLIRKITPGLFKKYRTAKDYAKTSLQNQLLPEQIAINSQLLQRISRTVRRKGAGQFR